MSNFSRPETSESFSPNKNPAWLGKLFLVRPNYNTTIVFDPTAGPKDIVNAFVVILDLIDPQTGKPTVIDGANIGGAGLVPQLRNKVDQLVLGRLEQGPAQGQKSGAFKLNANFSPEDENLASRWLTELGPVPPLPEAPPAPAVAPAAPPAQQWGQGPAQAPQAPAQQWGQAPASPPPADVWAGTNAAPQQGSWGAPPQAPQAAPAPVQQQWGQAPQAPAQQSWGQAQAPAPQAPAAQWGQAPAAPAPAPQAPFQDPAIVAFLTGKGIQVTPDMTMETLQTIASNIPQ